MKEQIRTIALPCLAMALLALVAGLVRNARLPEPLPLFRLSPAQQPEALPDPQAVARQVPQLDADMVRQLAEDPGTLLLDARSAAEFSLGHLPGALSLPVGDFASAWPALRARLQEAGRVVVYCSNPDCHDSLLVAGRLLAAGQKNLLLFRGGIEEWSSRGYDVEE